MGNHRLEPPKIALDAELASTYWQPYPAGCELGYHAALRVNAGCGARIATRD